VGCLRRQVKPQFFEFFEGTTLLCVSQLLVNTDFEKVFGNQRHCGMRRKVFTW